MSVMFSKMTTSHISNQIYHPVIVEQYSFPSNQKILVNDMFIVLMTWQSLKRSEQLVLRIIKNTDKSIHSTVSIQMQGHEHLLTSRRVCRFLKTFKFTLMSE